MTRMAYICADPGVPVFGSKGCSIHVQEVLRALRRRGAEIDLFACRFGDENVITEDGLRVHRLPSMGSGPQAERERQALSANRSLQQALEAAGPFDLVYERYSLWSFAGMQYADRAGIPGILEVNAPLIDEQAQHRGLHHRAAAEAVRKRCFHTASSIIAVSDEVAHGIKTDAQLRECVHVVANGVDPQRFRPEIEPASPASEKRSRSASWVR